MANLLTLTARGKNTKRLQLIGEQHPLRKQKKKRTLPFRRAGGAMRWKGPQGKTPPVDRAAGSERKFRWRASYGGLKKPKIVNCRLLATGKGGPSEKGENLASRGSQGRVVN